MEFSLFVSVHIQLKILLFLIALYFYTPRELEPSWLCLVILKLT